MKSEGEREEPQSGIPDYLLTQLSSECAYLASLEDEDIKQSKKKNTRNFEPKPMTKTTKKGKVLIWYKKHYPILGIVNEPSSSCALGVPPVLLPKLSFSRGRNNHHKLLNNVNFTTHSRNLFFELCLNGEELKEEHLFLNLQKNTNIVNCVLPEDQYDFFNTEIRKNADGKLIAYGEIPRSGGKNGIHPMRLPHLWMEMFRRGFMFERPGPQGIDGPWIRYDLEYLRSEFCFCFCVFYCAALILPT